MGIGHGGIKGELPHRGGKASLRGTMLLNGSYAQGVRITVLLFGPERDAAKTPHVWVELTGEKTCAALRSALRQAIPELQVSLLTARFAVNATFAPDSQALCEGDEVALIGMVSGG